MAEEIFEAGAWIYKMFFTFVVAIIVIGIVASSVGKTVNTQPIQKELLLTHILYGPDSIMYTDADGIVHPGIVDQTRFNQALIDKNFQYLPNYGGASITLIRSGTEESVYVNKITYENFKTEFLTGVSGGGKVTVHTYPVIIRDGMRESLGYLVVEVAMPEKT